MVDDQERAWHEQISGSLAAPDVAFEEHWRVHQELFASRTPEQGPPRIWWPDDGTVARSNLETLRREVGMEDYAALHAWSTTERSAFWERMVRRLRLSFDEPHQAVLGSDDPTHPQWLLGATGNAARWCFLAPDDQVAIVEATEGSDRLREVTYGKLRNLAMRFAAGLQREGLGEGDGVALYMPMTVECVAAYLGTILAGCHVVSIPDSFAAPEIATRLRLGTAKVVVTMDAFQRSGKTVPMAPKVHEALKINQFDALVVVIGDENDEEEGWYDFLDDENELTIVDDDLDRVSNVLFSSGTTGEPKAIPWTHLTPIKAAADGHLHQDIHSDDVVAWPTNIGWMMGPWLIYATFVNRATMFLYQGVPTTQHFLESADRAGVTVFGLVPAIVRAWKQAGVPPHALPKVRVWSSTGEASNARDYLYLMSLAGYRAPVIEYCGGTEIGGGHLTGTVVQPASPATFTTPAMGIDFVVLQDDGTQAGPGGMGEIFLIPPSIGLSERLLNKDHHEVYYAETPKGPEGQVLRRHGDEVQVLYGGFWAAQGRADDTMNLGGIKVGSIELETCMNAHPHVVETAAVGIPPKDGGADRLVVFAVLNGEAPEALQSELQQRIKEGLNPLFRIHDVVVVEKLPRTASNKVMRRELRAQYAA